MSEKPTKPSDEELKREKEAELWHLWEDCSDEVHELFGTFDNFVKETSLEE